MPHMMEPPSELRAKVDEEDNTPASDVLKDEHEQGLLFVRDGSKVVQIPERVDTETMLTFKTSCEEAVSALYTMKRTIITGQPLRYNFGKGQHLLELPGSTNLINNLVEKIGQQKVDHIRDVSFQPFQFIAPMEAAVPQDMTLEELYDSFVTLHIDPFVEKFPEAFKSIHKLNMWEQDMASRVTSTEYQTDVQQAMIEHMLDVVLQWTHELPELRELSLTWGSQCTSGQARMIDQAVQFFDSHFEREESPEREYAVVWKMRNSAKPAETGINVTESLATTVETTYDGIEPLEIGSGMVATNISAVPGDGD